MTLTIEVKIIWRIKGIDNFGFGNDKVLYNLKRGTPKKQCYNNGSIGYWINRKFYSLSYLKPLLYKKINEQIPF